MQKDKLFWILGMSNYYYMLNEVASAVFNPLKSGYEPWLVQEKTSASLFTFGIFYAKEIDSYWSYGDWYNYWCC